MTISRRSVNGVGDYLRSVIDKEIIGIQNHTPLSGRNVDGGISGGIRTTVAV